MFNGSSWDRQRSAPGTTGIPSVNTEGTKATYHQSANLQITTAGDNFIIQGAGTKTLRILRIAVSGFLTTGAACNVVAVRRSTASVGGTAGTLDTLFKFDTNNVAPTATVTAFTAAPTAGTSAGIVRRENAFFPSNLVGQPLVWDFSTRNGQAIVLRGTSDFLAINLSSPAAGAGSSINISVEWTEE